MAGPGVSLEDYARVERALAFAYARRDVPPDLASLAAHLGLSPARTRGLFQRWAGVGPQRLVQLLGAAEVERRMRSTAAGLVPERDAGSPAPGRRTDLPVTIEVQAPAAFRRAVAGLGLGWGLGDTPFGKALVVSASRGICHLAFVEPAAAGALTAALAGRWPQVRLERDDRAAGALLRRVFRAAPGADPGLHLWIAGSDFQALVWRTLLRVPSGGLISYAALAAAAGRPGAARAVGSAVARNPVAWLIPCHRVVHEGGDFGRYHWGAERKLALCAWEAARLDLQPTARRPAQADSPGRQPLAEPG